LFLVIIYYAYTTYANVESIEEHYFKGQASSEILGNNEELDDDHREDICYELEWWYIKYFLTKPYCEDDHLKKLKLYKRVYFHDGTTSIKEYIDVSEYCTPDDGYVKYCQHDLFDGNHTLQLKAKVVYYSFFNDQRDFSDITSGYIDLRVKYNNTAAIPNDTESYSYVAKFYEYSFQRLRFP
jgi:hypothetical protein